MIYDWINSISNSKESYPQRKYVTSKKIGREFDKDDMVMFRKFCEEVLNNEEINTIQIEALIDGYICPQIVLTAYRPFSKEERAIEELKSVEVKLNEIKKYLTP